MKEKFDKLFDELGSSDIFFKINILTLVISSNSRSDDEEFWTAACECLEKRSLEPFVKIGLITN